MGGGVIDSASDTPVSASSGPVEEARVQGQAEIREGHTDPSLQEPTPEAPLWACEACTCLNHKPYALACQVCGTERHIPEKTKEAAEPASAPSGGLGHFFQYFGEATEARVGEHVPEQLRIAALEEAKVARESLQARAEEWDEELALAAEQSRPPRLELKFAYAWTLVKCLGRNETDLGSAMLQALFDKDGYEHRDECAFGLAQEAYLSGDLLKARHWSEALLRIVPDSPRALQLHARVRTTQTHKRERNAEAVAVGGAVLVGLAGIALALASGGKRRS